MSAPAITHGCADPDCGYKTAPSTMPDTTYKRCPLCGGPWVANPPKQNKETGLTITEFVGDNKRRTIVVRPHLRSLYDALERGTHPTKRRRP